MAKGLNSYQINVDVKANTQQAKAQMQDLQNQLTKLLQSSSQTFSGSKFTLSKDITDATAAVAQLKIQLQEATNVDTGKLDLSKFSDSLRKSGMTLQSYQTTLNALGNSGQRAFASLAQSIVQAEIPLRRTNALVNEMWVTMKNTVRWQLSSSILHGVVGAYQQAIGYAHDLNESLNNIRIVTGQNSEQMARFAAEANKAAKALNTTTTEYTNASLIFYQQGLNDSQVKERTDVTIKMANVARQSAETVSDQLTSIWNNFYDGSKSLEYYADVMTALGAATASSTDEISEGLNKFAAIAETVGLSYEYAASALATVTSTTRQSADVVGTAFKTLFARLQDLELGQTLDDGTTLGKYSEALFKVGIDIKETNGEMKQMDKILDELGNKWETLSKDTQVALAQTVAGTRQYTQLVALMDNWDYFQENLGVAKGSNGALQAQADIYAESWEAARERVTASAEAIYSALLKDDFFIDLNNTLADVLETIEHLIKAFGGVKGVVTTIGFSVLTLFKTQISGAIDNFIFSIRGALGFVKTEMTDLQSGALKLLTANADKQSPGLAGDAISESYRQQALYQENYLKVKDKISESDRQVAELLSAQVNSMAEKVRLSAEELQNQEKSLRLTERQAAQTINSTFSGLSKEEGANKKQIQFEQMQHGNPNNLIKVDVTGIAAFKAHFDALLVDFKKGQKELGIFDQAIEQALDVDLTSNGAKTELKAIIESIDKCTLVTKNMPRQIKGPFEALKKALQDPGTSADELRTKWELFDDALANNKGLLQEQVGGFTNLKNALNGLKAAFPNHDFTELENILNNLQTELYETGGAEQNLEGQTNGLSSMVKNLSMSLRELTTSSLTAGQTITSLAQGLSSLAMAIQSAQGLKDIWDDDTISTGEKLLQTCITLGMVIPGVMTGVKSLWSGLGGVVTGIKTKVIPSFAALSASTAGSGVAAAGAAPGVLTFGASLQAALGPIGWICLALTALVGIFALVITGITNANSALNQANKDFKQATVDAQEAANAVDKAKNAYEDLKDTIEDYQEARDALDDLIEGTDEFKNKIQEANAYARELMETYGAKGKYNAETGIWEITEEEQKNALSRYNEQLQQAQINNAAAQSNLKLAANKQTTASLATDNDKGYWDYYGRDVGNNILGMTVTGATAGAGLSAAGVVTAWTAPITALIGGLIGAASTLIGGFASAGIAVAEQEEQNKKQIVALENLQALYIENGGDLEAAKRALTESDQNLITALGVTDSELDALCSEVAANTAAIRENNKQIVDDYFKDNAVYKNSEHQDALSNLMASNLQIKTQDLYDTKWSDAAGQYSDEDIQKKYAEKMGYTWVSDEDNNIGKYADAEGNEITIGDAQARMYLAQQEALVAVGANIETLNTNLNTLSTNLTAASQLAYSQAAGGDITGVKIGMAGEGTQSFATAADLQSYLGVDDETFKAIWTAKGYASADAYVEAFNSQLSGFESQVAELDLVNQITGSGELTLGVGQAFQKVLEQMNLGPAGKNAGQNFVNQFNDQIMSKVDPKDYEKVLGGLTKIDWSSWDAGQQAVDFLAEYGVQIDITDKKWLQFVADTRNATLSTPDMEKLVADLQKIQEITKDLQIGDILSQEDFELLMNYNTELAKYFAILADGTAMMVGDPLDLQQEMAETVKQKYKEAADAALNKADYYTDQYIAGSKALGGESNLDKYSKSVAYQNNEGNWYYRQYEAKRQLEFLESQGYGNTEEGAANLEKWKNDIYGLDENGATTTTGVLTAIGEAVASMSGEYENAARQAELWSAQYQASLNSIALNAQDAAERVELLKSGDINTEAYSYAAMAARNTEKWEGMDVDEVNDYAKAIQNAAGASKLLEDNISEEVAEDVALYTKKMNQGVDKLSKGFKGWQDIIKKSDKASQEYVEAMVDMKDAMSDVLGTSEEFISDDFIVKNLEDIEKAANGDAEAIDRLSAALGKEIILDITADGSQAEKAALDAHSKLQSLLEGKKVGFTVTADMDTSGILEGAQEVISAAGMTVEQAQAYFNSLGYEPTFVMEDQEVPLEGTRTITENVVVGSKVLQGPGEGQERIFDYIASADTRTESVPMGTQIVSVPALSADGTPKIESLHKKAGGGMNNNSSLNPGKTGNTGGGSKPKKTSKTHQTAVVDRYKEINDAIELSKKNMDDASRAAEGLWGKARLNEMEKVRNEMGKQLDLLRQRKAAAMTDLTEDQDWLNNTIAQEYGITFTFDPNDGTISNYYEIMDQLHQDLRNAEIRAGQTLDKESEQEEIDAINEKISALQEAIDIYEATRKEVNETDTAIKDMIRSIQEANLEELNLQLEMEIMIDDAQLKKIEYYLDKVKEDIWSMAESAALMTGQSKELFNIDLGQAEVWTDKFADFQKQYNDLVYAYTHIDPKTGETFINQEQFVKALEELQSQIYDNLGNINELDKTMIGYYGETLAAAAEELSKFTDMMDHHNEVLDHYQSLLEIMDKSKDFERMKTLLKTQVEVSKNSAEVSKANYEMLQAELAEKKAAYEALDPNDTSYEAQVIKQQWLDAQATANEAQIKMLEDAEAWTESLKALLETELEELGDNLEKALAGDFGSLNYMMTSMERANSLQEEYLTITNKVYETNKLMRTAQQEIDKTSNTVAKRRMAQFIEETQQMQNQNKLSQYELEIQQAKYDLLLAEIALEEAQSAKSTVRLQRDSEGNFGYVYTADQNEVANAQQQLEDAQNALYNIGLEGANKYAEQYAQTIQEMNDAVRELTEQWQNGEIASKEEYQAKMLELEEYYGEKLKQFSHLHSIAVQTDSRVANDAWTLDFADMTTKTQYWMTQVSSYADQVGQAFGRYQGEIAKVEEYAGTDLDSLKEKTEKIKEENEKLVTSITDSENGLLAAMQKEIDKVGEITLKYAEWRDTIQDVIDKQEELAKQINKDIEQETDDDETNDRKPGTETPKQTPPEGEPNGNLGDDGTPSYKKGVLSWTGNGSARIWTDSAGKTYSATSAEGRAIQTAFNKAYGANDGYKGDYFLGWNKLNADVLHEKYGLSTGGYTGDWSGSFGKLAFLHQKELVLNKQDTENMLNAMDLLDHILQMIDLQSASAQLGGILSSPSFSNMNTSALEQQVHIEASFPGVQDRNEIEEAFNNLINKASQYAYRK